ncbi:MAG: 5-(carboxyamino)imidazole ribonucleotide mutase [Chitinophagales bacterium]|jgi:5-(carboxyamino)imidazole ribonucleotide mutase|nr:5-(carboxyamino)imidazole ribonucleotide mutase [Chitinophagales bacterium]
MIPLKIAIVMGSKSDLPIMSQAAEILEYFSIPYDLDIVSAHRTPEYMIDFALKAHDHYACVIAGAGGAAHLPGMIASLTALPVIGVPIKSSNSIDGWDSVLSILQMPSGVPVATVALNGAKNAGILAVQILGSSDKVIYQKLLDYKEKMKEEVAEMRTSLTKID